MPEKLTLFGAWRELRAIWKRQQTEPGYHVSTRRHRTPEAAWPAAAGRDDDRLGGSIGDLTPGILARADA